MFEIEFSKNYPKLVRIFKEKYTENILQNLKSWGSGRGACACLDTSGVACGSASDKHTPHACF